MDREIPADADGENLDNTLVDNSGGPKSVLLYCLVAEYLWREGSSFGFCIIM